MLAALTPPRHRLTIIDENVEPIDFARCAEADIVGVTGMVVQRVRMREILTELKRLGAFTVVGGPWVSVTESYFGDLADVVFVGEAEALPRLKSLIGREAGGRGRVTLVLDLPGREIEVALPGGFRVDPKIRAAVKSLPGIVDVHDI